MSMAGQQQIFWDVALNENRKSFAADRQAYTRIGKPVRINREHKNDMISRAPTRKISVLASAHIKAHVWKV